MVLAGNDAIYQPVLGQTTQRTRRILQLGNAHHATHGEPIEHTPGFRGETNGEQRAGFGFDLGRGRMSTFLGRRPVRCEVCSEVVFLEREKLIMGNPNFERWE